MGGVPEQPSHESRPRHDSGPAQNRTRLVALAAGTLLMLLVVTVATSEPVGIADRAPSLPWELPEFDLSEGVPTTTLVLPSALDSQPQAPSRSWELFTALLEYLLLAVTIALAVLVLKGAWQRRPKLTWRRRPGSTDFLVLEDVAASVIADAEAQRAVLQHGEARNAIVGCWLRLESAVSDSGFEQDPADTTAEFTEKVLTGFDVDRTALEQLSSLYREARFSTHQMDETRRADAITALDAVHASLRLRAEQPGQLDSAPS